MHVSVRWSVRLTCSDRGDRRAGVGTQPTGAVTLGRVLPASHPPPNLARSFVGLVFDQDGDGTISRGEFYYMIEFIVACNYIESLSKEHGSKVRGSGWSFLPPPPHRLFLGLIILPVPFSP